MRIRRRSGLFDLRPGEGRPVGLIVATSFFASAGLMIGQSSIEALFFARYGVDKLPVMYLLLGASMFVMSLGLSAVLGRFGQGRAFLLIPLAIAAFALAGRLTVALGVGLTYPALWLLQGVAQFMLSLAVWGLAGIVTDTRQAKRFFPLIAAGAVTGQVVGGVATRPLATSIGTDNLLLVWVAALALVMLLGRKLIAVAGARHIAARRVTSGRPIEQLRQGFDYVRGSSLMRWMALGAVLFSVLFFSLYLPFSRTATVRYPDPEALAGFFGLFYALSTAVALALSLFVTNRLLARFGIPTVMLVLPLLYVVAFGVLTIRETFAALLAFRFAQVVWMQGGAVSSWEAVINTVPPERRDQTRAFLYGAPTQVGTVLAGVIALVGESAFSPRALYGVGLASAVLATLAMVGVRRDYPRELVLALREGRPSVFGATPGGQEPFGHAREDATAVAVAAAASSDADVRVRRVAAVILGELEGADAARALLAALRDDDPAVREAAIRSLERGTNTDVAPHISGLLADPDPGVRRAAIEALVSLGGSGSAARAVRSLLRDVDPAVRARAAAALLDMGPDPQAMDAVVELSASPDADARASAFRALASSNAMESFDLALGGLGDPAVTVRAEAARALAAIDPIRAIDPLIEATADDSVVVRRAVAEALGAIGERAVHPLVRALLVPERQEGALLALERVPFDNAAGDVRRFAADSVSSALENHRLASGIDGGDERRRLLRDSLVARAERQAVTALRAAALLGDRSVMLEALESISVKDQTQRANALEVIESVGDPHVVRPLLRLWEAGPPRVSDPDWLDVLRRDADDWIRACAELAARSGAGPEGRGPVTQTLDTLPLMERVLFLRKVPLFADLAPSDLKPIALIAEEHTYDDGDVIAEQGEIGDAMHIIVRGDVAIVGRGSTGDHVIAVRSSGDVVGEMAVITSEPRMAGIVARGAVRVLSIRQRQFESILRERPETSLGVIRILCQRLAEER